ncbi:hypothetical protein E2C01_064690 [Portunus trituberculatus]|uniref:Uncharacterized protein n=1 Tax=Portunus trituberculatus TaxID=210409 RepID=A0A5B7HDP9_PORTR|nr:hypothetical protein [Portunus trituberculatus]
MCSGAGTEEGVASSPRHATMGDPQLYYSSPHRTTVSLSSILHRISLPPYPKPHNSPALDYTPLTRPAPYPAPELILPLLPSVPLTYHTARLTNLSP